MLRNICLSPIYVQFQYVHTWLGKRSDESVYRSSCSKDLWMYQPTPYFSFINTRDAYIMPMQIPPLSPELFISPIACREKSKANSCRALQVQHMALGGCWPRLQGAIIRVTSWESQRGPSEAKCQMGEGRGNRHGAEQNWWWWWWWWKECERCWRFNMRAQKQLSDCCFRKCFHLESPNN